MGLKITVRGALDHDFSTWKCEGFLSREGREAEVDIVQILGIEERCMPGYIPGIIHAQYLLEKARELGVTTGLREAEAILRNQAMIPRQWRNSFLIFPGEIWTSPHGMEHIIGLSFDTIAKWWGLYLSSNLLGGYSNSTRLVIEA